MHRDLKPANVLIASDAEPYEVKITDFGLAKLYAEETSAHTKSNAFFGTPSYMAPEQAKGDIKQIGPASDVYALGAILYELLTGRPPFRGDSPMETLQLLLFTEPVSIHRLAPASADLATTAISAYAARSSGATRPPENCARTSNAFWPVDRFRPAALVPPSVPGAGAGAIRHWRPRSALWRCCWSARPRSRFGIRGNWRASSRKPKPPTKRRKNDCGMPTCGSHGPPRQPASRAAFRGARYRESGGGIARNGWSHTRPRAATSQCRAVVRCAHRSAAGRTDRIAIRWLVCLRYVHLDRFVCPLDGGWHDHHLPAFRWRHNTSYHAEPRRTLNQFWLPWQLRGSRGFGRHASMAHR